MSHTLSDGVDAAPPAPLLAPPRVVFSCASVGFGGTTVMGPIDLEVRDGEFLAIVGPSGCGKSTLLNLIAGTLAPATGGVRYDGQPVCGPNHRVGYLTQKNFLPPARLARWSATCGCRWNSAGCSGMRWTRAYDA